MADSYSPGPYPDGPYPPAYGPQQPQQPHAPRQGPAPRTVFGVPLLGCGGVALLLRQALNSSEAVTVVAIAVPLLVAGGVLAAIGKAAGRLAA